MKVLPRDCFQVCTGLIGLKDKAEFIRILEHQDGEGELRCNATKSKKT